MSLFDAPKVEEDQAIRAQREQQQTAADNSLTSQIQTDLRRRMRARLQQFGFAPAAAPDLSPATSPATGQAPTLRRRGFGSFV